MLAVLPIVTFALIWTCVVARRPALGWRVGFLVASLIWGVLTTVTMEGLSLFDGLIRPFVAAIWLASAVVTALATPWGRVRRWRTQVRPGRDVGPDGLLLVGIAAVLAVAGLLAVTGGISTNDASDYHLPRVMHWIENRSVAFYPTAVSRQLNLNPWAEYAIAQFMVLGGGEAWANLVQWFALLGCAIGVSLIARELGAGTHGQIFAAVFAATIPMAVLQSATAQNDLAVAYWVIVLAWGTLRLRAASWPVSGRLLPAALFLGTATGLAILTKTTGYLFTAPFLLWLTVIALRRFHWRAVPLGAMAAATGVALNLGHGLRNLALYGSPMGPGQESPPGQDWGRYTNAEISPATLLSNVVRYLALNVGLPDRAAAQTATVTRWLGDLGIDASDPATTWAGQAFSIAAPHTNEDGAGNPVHLSLIGLLLVAIVAVPRLRRVPVWGFTACAVAGFLAFSLLLKWSPWSTRLYLTSLLLFAPVAGLAFGLIRWQWLSRVAATVLLAGTLPYLLYAQHRPLVGPDVYQPTELAGSVLAQSGDDRLFATRPQLEGDFIAAAGLVRDARCGQVGLLRFDAAEYPVWALLETTLPWPVDIEHVGVINDTASLSRTAPYADFAPCVVLAFRVFSGDDPTVEINGREYVRTWDSTEVALYRPAWYAGE